MRSALSRNLRAIFEGGIETGLRNVRNYECADLFKLTRGTQIRSHRDDGGDEWAGERCGDGVAGEGERENVARMFAER